jgi:hypothetical protein
MERTPLIFSNLQEPPVWWLKCHSWGNNISSSNSQVLFLLILNEFTTGRAEDPGMFFRHLHRTGNSFQSSMEATEILTPGRKLRLAGALLSHFFCVYRTQLQQLESYLRSWESGAKFLHRPIQYTGCFGKQIVSWKVDLLITYFLSCWLLSVRRFICYIRRWSTD